MPIRTTPFVDGEFYHIYNRGVEKRQTFLTKRDHMRFINTIEYYRFQNPFPRFSVYLRLANSQREEIMSNFKKHKKFKVDIHSFVLMPNHFHMILQQVQEGGISSFMRHVLDSYTKYFNIKHERVGPLFQGQFKAVRIEDNEQLLHLSRYVHLNPFTTYLVKKLDDLLRYPWSSFPQYMGIREGWCITDDVMSEFSSKAKYQSFVLDRADYQQNLHAISHLTHE